MKQFTFTISLLIALNAFSFTPVTSASEKIVVVVSINNPVNEMTHSEVIDLFMGKYVAFPDGSKAIVTELDGEQAVKKAFYKKLVGRSLASVNAYWSRLRFTGRQRSPILHPSESNVAEFIAQNDLAIGYLSASNVNSNMKVVFELNE